MADYEDKIGKLSDDQLAQAKNFGFAPGHYFGMCRACGEKFTGDKRAWRCLPCALAEQPLADQK